MVIHNEKVLVCDFCERSEVLEPGQSVAVELSEDRLPERWRRVYVPGWAGHFHACCEAHAKALTDKYVVD